MKTTNYLSKNLKFIRKKSGFSQADMAHLLRYKVFSTYQSWEAKRTEPNIKTIIRISQIFNISIDKLLCCDLSKPKKK